LALPVKGRGVEAMPSAQMMAIERGYALPDQKAGLEKSRSARLAARWSV
jgi:hypothetical protein